LIVALMLSVILAACGTTPAAQPTTAPAAAEPTTAPAAAEPTAAPVAVEPTTAPAAAEPTAAPVGEDAVTITYFTFSAAPDQLTTLEQMIAAFQAENPNITVKVETAPFDQY